MSMWKSSLSHYLYLSQCTYHVLTLRAVISGFLDYCQSTKQALSFYYSQPCDIAWYIEGDEKNICSISEAGLTLQKAAGHLPCDLANVYLESRDLSRCSEVGSWLET